MLAFGIWTLLNANMLESINIVQQKSKAALTRHLIILSDMYILRNTYRVASTNAHLPATGPLQIR